MVEKSYHYIANIIGCIKTAAFDIRKNIEKQEADKTFHGLKQPELLRHQWLNVPPKQICIKLVCKITLNVQKQLNFQKLSVNIARKMIKNCECTRILVDISKTCSGKEKARLNDPELNMYALQERLISAIFLRI